MRKEKKLIIILDSLAVFLALLSAFSFIYLESAPISLIFFASFIYFVSLSLMQKRSLINETWKKIMTTACLNINFTSSVFGIKKAIGAIVQEICHLPGIEAAWIIKKEEDGFYRIQVSRGGVSHSDVGIKDIYSYLKIEEGDIEELFLTSSHPEEIKLIRRGLKILHIPLNEEERLIGILSVAVHKRSSITHKGLEHFESVAEVLEQLYDNAARKKEVESMAIKVRDQVDSASDELTKTNVRLINRVKELKSLYSLSVRVFTSPNIEFAADEVFQQARDILMVDEALYFQLENEEFVFRYASSEKFKPEKKTSIPIYLLSDNKGIIIDNPEEIKEVAPIARALGLSQLILVPAKVGNRVSGLLMGGSIKSDKFDSGDLEILFVYAGRLAEFIERKELTNEVVRDNKRLNELLDVKDKFISLVSHEFRTPLTAIKGYTEILSSGEEGELVGRQAEFLNEIAMASERLEETIESVISLADYSRGQVKLDKEMVVWSELISDLISRYSEEAAEKEISLLDKSEDSVGKVRVDRQKLSEAFGQILSNAVKFTESGGSIIVETNSKGDFFETVIRDTGVGMSPDLQSRVFEKFVQFQEPLTRSITGLGIGLSLAKEIIESHLGTISLSSEPGSGTEVRILIPTG